MLLEALSVGSAGAPLLLRTLVAALSKVEETCNETLTVVASEQTACIASATRCR